MANRVLRPTRPQVHARQANHGPRVDGKRPGPQPAFEAAAISDAMRLLQGRSAPTVDAVEPEPSAEVGNDAFIDNEAFYTIWDAIEAGRPVKSTWGYDDTSVTQFIAQMFENTLKPESLGPAAAVVAPDALQLLRHFARAAELGETITITDPASFWNRKWPVNDATAELLVRAAKALHVDPSTIPFNGAPLTQHLPSVKASSVDPYGHLESRLPSFRLASELARTPALRQGVRQFVDGLGTPEELAGVVEARLKLPPAQSEHIADLEFYGPVADRRIEIGWSGYPVGRGPLTQATHLKAYGELPKDRSFFVDLASDENLKEYLQLYRKDVSDVLKAGDFGGATAAEAYRWAARVVELFKGKTYQESRLELSPYDLRDLSALLRERGLPDYSPEALPEVMRLAKALEVPLDEVIVSKRPDGTTLNIMQRAGQVGLEPIRPVDTDPTPLLSVFRSEGNDRDKLEALVQLQGTAPDSPAFWDVVRGAADLLAEGALEPIRWHTLREDEQRRLATLISREDNLGAATILTGLFVEGVPDQPRNSPHPYYDAVRGPTSSHTRFYMSEWSSMLGPRLSRLTPEQKLFVLADVLKDPPTFGTLPFRLGRVTQPDGEAFRWASDWDRIIMGRAGVMRVLVDLAIFRGEEAKATLIELMKGFEITPEDLGLAMAGERGIELIPDSTLELLENAARAALTSGKADDVERLTAAIDALPRHIDRTALVSALLTRIHEAKPFARVFDTVEQTQRLASRRVAPIEVIDAGANVDLSSFAEIAGVEPMEVTKAELRVAAAPLMVALGRLKLDLMASSSAAKSRAEALALVKEHLGPRLTAASSAEEKLEVYSIGRAVLNDFERFLAASAMNADS